MLKVKDSCTSSRARAPELKNTHCGAYVTSEAFDCAKFWQTKEEKVFLENVKRDEPFCDWDISYSFFTKSKKKARRSCDSVTPPSSPSSPETEELIEFHRSSWKAFSQNPDGTLDPNVVVYKSEGTVPSDFVPFDLDRYLAEKLLKELDLDPSLAG